MLNYVDNQNNIGYIPARKDIEEISEQISQSILPYKDTDILVAIPDSANDLIKFFQKNVDGIVASAPLTKSCWIHQVDKMTENKSVIILDDVICHGETIKALINSVKTLSNIKLIIIYFNIISKKICLYDIEKGEFTLSAENKFYYIYFIEEKFLLRIPTLIYATYNFILMKSDVQKHGFDYKYYINGERICREDVLKML